MNSELKIPGLVSDVRLLLLLCCVSSLSGFGFASEIPPKGAVWMRPQSAWQRLSPRRRPVGPKRQHGWSPFPVRTLERPRHLAFEAVFFGLGPWPSQ